MNDFDFNRIITIKSTKKNTKRQIILITKLIQEKKRNFVANLSNYQKVQFAKKEYSRK